MKHITITRAIITDVDHVDDKETLMWWLSYHRIDPSWLTLEQDIEFDDRSVTYTQYRHDDHGALKFVDANATEPLTERVRHICTLSCEGHKILKRLKTLEIHDERAAD